MECGRQSKRERSVHKVKNYKAVLSLAFCALLLLLPCRTYAANVTELTVEIPFSFRNDSSVPHTCKVAIEPIDGAPAPEQSVAETEDGKEGRLTLRFSHSGLFQYRVYQTGKDVGGVIYDDRIYTVTFVVRNAKTGGLSCTKWAYLNGEEKVDAIAFINCGKPDEPASPEAEDSEAGSPEAGATEAGSPEAGVTESGILAPEISSEGTGIGELPGTGDNSRLELYLTTLFSSMLTLVFIAIAGKHGRKEGDRI